MQDDYLDDDACDGSSKIWKASYQYLLKFLEERGLEKTIALGSDFNGLVHSPSQDLETCDGNEEQAARQTNRVEYPFRSFDEVACFSKAKVVEREFDINTDGLANVGLLPDFIEDPEKLVFRMMT